MKWREFNGKTVKEAIENACKELECEETLLEIDIVQEGARGFLGLVGQRNALIRARKRDILKEVMEVDPPDKRAGARKRSNKPSEAKRESPPRPERETAPESRTNKPEPKPKPEAEVEDDHPPAEAPEETRAALEEAREALAGILERMEMDAEVKPKVIDSAAYLDIKGDGSGLLIGKRGQTLDALQFVVNKIINKPDRRKEKVEVIVDTENYRLRRREQFREKAIRKCRQAKKSLRPVSFEPMPANERRLVHMILSDDREIYTKSVGEGPRRHVIVYPKKGAHSKRRRR
jgi:spoIIIJ-associated protein